MALRVALASLAALPALAVGAAVAHGAGDQGAQRWLPLGPLQLNASEAVLPWALFGLLGRRRVPVASLSALVALQVLHLAQPDAAQASVLAALGALLLPGRGRAALATVVILVALAVVTWLRPDEVAPVPHVEGILTLAAARGAPWIALAALAGVATLAPVALLRGGSRPSRATLAIPLWLAAGLAVSLVAAFPVPLYGAGAGPILGWCGVVAWAAAARRIPEDPGDPAR